MVKVLTEEELEEAYVEDLLRIPTQCLGVLEKWGKVKTINLNKDGLSLASDFARALDCRLTVKVVEDD